MRRWTGALLAGALLSAAVVATTSRTSDETAEAAPAGAVYNGGAAAGQPGDPMSGPDRFFVRLQTVAVVPGSTPESVTLAVTGDGRNLTLNLIAPPGQTLAKGSYLDSPGDEMNKPQLAISLEGGYPCNQGSYGNFTIDDIAFSGNDLTRLAVRTSHRCNSYEAPVFSMQVVLNMPYGPLTPVAGGEVVPMNPVRALDTRVGPPISGGESVQVQVAGKFGVPANATAVVVNATATDVTDTTYVTLFPWGSEPPFVSNLNPTAGQTIPNLAVVKIGAQGSVGVFNAEGSAHVLLDIAGYVVPGESAEGTRFHEVAPVRLLDTRDTRTPLGPGESRVLDIDNTGVIPPSPQSRAVVLNVTAVNSAGFTYVTVYPADQGVQPLASNLNVASGAPVPNLVVSDLGINGDVRIFNAAGSVDIIVDVMGYFDTDKSTGAGRFVAMDPSRIYDTRTMQRTLNNKSQIDLGIVGMLGKYPFEVSGVVMNTTVAGTSAPSFLTLWPLSSTRPWASNLNWKAGETRPNLAMVGTGHSGFVSAWNEVGTADVIFDVAGWFTG